jgi:hypothetical protein
MFKKIKQLYNKYRFKLILWAIRLQQYTVIKYVTNIYKTIKWNLH